MRKWGGTVRQCTGPVALACAAALIAAGCGSSSKPGSATGTTAKTATIKEGLQPEGKIDYASPPANAPTQSGTIQIHYKEIAIEPDTVKAKVGSTVRWTNEDSEPCNVTSEGGTGGYKFASKDFGEGGTFELKLDKPGTIHYECTHFPTTMNGTIEVVE